MKKYLAIAILLISTTACLGQGLKRDGKKIMDHTGNEIILRGMGLGGWMLMEGYMMHSSDVAGTQHEFRNKLIDLMGVDKTDEFFDAWLANHVTAKDIDSLSAWGFNSIRLPMHYNLFTLPIEDEPIPGQNTWLNKGFVMVDSLLQWCESNQMYLILDLHAAPGGQGANADICDYDPSKPSLWESEANRDKTVALWIKLAERYKDETWIGGYDLLNEVNWDLPGNVQLRTLYEEITAGIRAVDTNHIIFIEGNGFANDFTGLTPPWDENMAYSFHKYWNFNDPGSIQWVLDIREQNNVPLWMGEAGENSNVWFADAISLFEEKNIGWSWWPMKRIETIVGPYSIEYSEGYRDVLAYWRDEGPQPSAAETFDGMMELAQNSNSSNCLYRKDVPDAQIRQIITNDTKAFTTHLIPGLIFTPDFDLGKINYAYFDNDAVNYSMSTGEFQAWNNGWHYRNDGVDIEPNNDPIRSNGYHVSYIGQGEWLNYTVNIEAAASYTAIVRVASEQTGGKFHLSLDDEAITAYQSVSSTGGWLNFVDQEIYDVILPQGQHVLTLFIDKNTPFNISSIDFIASGPADSIAFGALYGQTRNDERSIEISCNHPISSASVEGALNAFSVYVEGVQVSATAIRVDTLRSRTIILDLENYILHTQEITVSYSGTQIKSVSGQELSVFSDLDIRNMLPMRAILPDKIEAEDFVYMEGFGIESTTDVGGGYNLGYANPGDFADYLIYNESEVEFQLSLRVASQYSSGKLGYYLVDDEGGETELIQLSIPSTGGWQNWNTINEDVSIPEGLNTLRIKAISGEFNLNWFKFEILNSVPDRGMNLAPHVFPNPVYDNRLNINLDQALSGSIQIAIYNMNGQLVSANRYQMENGEIVMDMGRIPKGIYALRFVSEDDTFSCKILRL